MFSPLDILYIVLAFCVLWFTAALFWLIWQAATMLRHINDAVSEGREVLHKVEAALTGIRERFESATSSMGVVVQLAAKGMEYWMDKKVGKGKKKLKE
ncbi:hypothetical protein FJZ23_02985 [Candidatus Parcubacteria bacterium]|nr:hypothetical protein [Candidatus Parcubacteria bacterium]